MCNVHVAQYVPLYCAPPGYIHAHAPSVLQLKLKHTFSITTKSLWPSPLTHTYIHMSYLLK